MAFEIGRDESVADAVRRVLLEQIEQAARGLHPSVRRSALDDSIHEARKSFKRIRSVLRLARPALPDRRFRRENARFRELGRALSSPRESRVAALTIDALAAHFGSVLRPGPFAELRAHFVERNLVALWETLDRGSLDDVREGLPKARRKVERMSFSDDAELAWADEVRRAYRAGARWMARAESSRLPDAYHEWRKEAKHLRYHLRFLRPAWSGQLGAAEERLHRLTDILGHHHDLTDLLGQLVGNPAVTTTDLRRDEADALEALAVGRRHQLEREARELGLGIYSRRPEDLLQRFGSLWAGWRSTQTTRR